MSSQRLSVLFISFLCFPGCGLPQTSTPSPSPSPPLDTAPSADIDALLVQNQEALTLKTSCPVGTGADCGIEVTLSPISSATALSATGLIAKESASDWQSCTQVTASGEAVAWGTCDTNAYAYVDSQNWFEIQVSASSNASAFNAATCTVSAYTEGTSSTGSASDQPLTISRCGGSSAYFKALQAENRQILPICPASALSAKALGEWHAEQSAVSSLLGFCTSTTLPCTYQVGASTTLSTLVLSYAAFNVERPEHLTITCSRGSGSSTPVFTLELTFPVAGHPYATSGRSATAEEPLALIPYYEHHDLDHDGYGIPTQTTGQPSWLGNYLGPPWLESSQLLPVLELAAQDCDEADPFRHPGAVEECNGVDDNCNGLEDEPDGQQCAQDRDQDGFPGQADCNDGAAAIHPGALETCNGLDDDCDQIIDEAVTVSWHRDADADQFAPANAPEVWDCAETHLSGFTRTDRLRSGVDCDDTQSSVYPDAPEPCDLLDNDCDQLQDEEQTCAQTDFDGDGVPQPQDCDDLDPTAFPGALELCDGQDNTCDGSVDEGFQGACTDEDGDGVTESEGDCDDTRAGVYPVQVEGQWGTRFTYDDDADGFGDLTDPGLGMVVGCALPRAALWLDVLAVDCDDQNPALSPVMPEACDGQDNNCSGAVDEDLPGLCFDDDGDGFTEMQGDCDDDNPALNPQAVDRCDGLDNDCSGLPDEGFDGICIDDDLDGFSEADGDCDDTRKGVHPVALDGQWGTHYSYDHDLDGYGDSEDPEAGFSLTCILPRGAIWLDLEALDCDDTRPELNPGVLELCDTLDNNCDGAVDEWVCDVPIAIAAGPNLSLGLKQDGTVWVWGWECGWYQHDTPYQKPGLEQIRAISTGLRGHVLALDADGHVWAWGENGSGQLGVTPSSCTMTPARIPGLENVTAVAAGGGFSLALDRDGILWSWGSNDWGQLGDGTFTSRSTPQPVPGLSPVASVTTSEATVLAVMFDGTVMAWGANYFYQLGDGSTTSRPAPQAVPNVQDVVMVSVGQNHSIALSGNGEIWGWGINENGELGPLEPTPSGYYTTPIKSDPTQITSAAAGMGPFMMAIMHDGSLWSAGANQYDVLGYSCQASACTGLQQVPGIEGVKAVSPGQAHVLVLLQDGTLWAWGYGDSGVLGDGKRTSSSTPVKVLWPVENP